MCLMCMEIAKGRMKISEARTALRELIDTSQTPDDSKHYQDLDRATDEELLEIAKENSQKS